MKVVIPMAGRGSRLIGQDPSVPKPLISIVDQPMVYWAFQSLRNISYSQLIFVALVEHEKRFNLEIKLRSFCPSNKTKIIYIDQVTEGQLCTVLAARWLLETTEDLLIANCDTLIQSDLGSDIANRQEDCHGIISVANLPGEKWSFAKVDAHGKVTQVTEKKRISNYASTGLYYFSDSQEFLEAADEILFFREKTRDEYYVIPVYQKYIARGWNVYISEAQEVWDMGTPEALQKVIKIKTNTYEFK